MKRKTNKTFLTGSIFRSDFAVGIKGIDSKQEWIAYDQRANLSAFCEQLLSAQIPKAQKRLTT